MRLLQAALLGIFTAASIRATFIPTTALSTRSAELTGTEFYAHEIKERLAGRALPPCPPCGIGKYERPGQPETANDVAIEEREIGHTLSKRRYEKDYWPDMCNQKDIVCMLLGPRVDYVRGGIDKPAGHWDRVDGSEIYAWKYWQSTILFSTPGGSATTYPAHGTVYSCVKGVMTDWFYDDKVKIQSDDIQSDKSKEVCRCSCALSTAQYFGTR